MGWGFGLDPVRGWGAGRSLEDLSSRTRPQLDREAASWVAAWRLVWVSGRPRHWPDPSALQEVMSSSGSASACGSPDWVSAPSVLSRPRASGRVTPGLIWVQLGEAQPVSLGN